MGHIHLICLIDSQSETRRLRKPSEKFHFRTQKPCDMPLKFDFEESVFPNSAFTIRHSQFSIQHSQKKDAPQLHFWGTSFERLYWLTRSRRLLSIADFADFQAQWQWCGAFAGRLEFDSLAFL